MTAPAPGGCAARAADRPPPAGLRLPVLLLGALLLASGACTPAPAPPPQPVKHLAGNWWSDGTYRVDRRDPESIRQFWHDQDTEIELLLVAGMPGIDPATVDSLNAKCQAKHTPDSYWLGWRMQRGQHNNPQGIVCGKGGVISPDEVALACSRVSSRGRHLVLAWHKPELRTFACREP